MSAASFVHFLKQINYPQPDQIRLAECEWIFEVCGDAGLFVRWLLTGVGAENVLSRQEQLCWRALASGGDGGRDGHSLPASTPSGCPLWRGAELDRALNRRRQLAVVAAHGRHCSLQHARHLAAQLQFRRLRLRQMSTLRDKLQQDMECVLTSVSQGKRCFEQANQYRRRQRQRLQTAVAALAAVHHKLVGTGEQLLQQASAGGASRLLQQLEGGERHVKELAAESGGLVVKHSVLDTLRHQLAADIADVVDKLCSAGYCRLLWRSRTAAAQLQLDATVLSVPALSGAGAGGCGAVPRASDAPPLPAHTGKQSLEWSLVRRHVQQLVSGQMAPLRGAASAVRRCRTRWTDKACEAAVGSAARSAWLQLAGQWQYDRSARAAALLCQLQLLADEQLLAVKLFVEALRLEQHRQSVPEQLRPQTHSAAVSAHLTDFALVSIDDRLAACAQQLQLPKQQLQLLDQLHAALNRSHVPKQLQQLHDGCHRLRSELNRLVRLWEREGALPRATPLWAVALVRPTLLPQAVSRPLPVACSAPSADNTALSSVTLNLSVMSER